MVDVIYIAASAHDARFTRICVASVRRFYPDVAIRLLVGGPLQRGLMEELRSSFAVEDAGLPRRDYGWGFVKLEPLFDTASHRFLVLDSDTVFTGRVLSLADRDEDFIVDDEPAPPTARAVYYDWDRLSAPVPAFFFNSGQWFGRSGVITREDFAGLVTWGSPPRLAQPQAFMGGEQGVLNFVLNAKVRSGDIRVARVPLMCWPGHGMQGITAATLADGSCRARVVHWAGMKRTRLRDMIGADVLYANEQRYYDRLPLGSARRVLNRCRDLIQLGRQSLSR